MHGMSESFQNQVNYIKHDYTCMPFLANCTDTEANALQRCFSIAIPDNDHRHPEHCLWS